jgi:hypothetical protein
MTGGGVFTTFCPDPTCRMTVIVPFSGEMTLASNGRNFDVQCPRCGKSFDATDGRDGTFSTIGGRLTRVAEFIAQRSPEELAALRTRLAALTEADDAEGVGQELEQMGATPPPGGWTRTWQTTKRTITTGNRVLDAVLKVVGIYELAQHVDPAEVVKIVEAILQGRG